MPLVEMQIYTDGACEGNQFKKNWGGWGYVVILNNKVFHRDSGGAQKTTNNRMELFAVIKALEFAFDLTQKSSTPKTEYSFTIFSDSAYIVNCIHQKWYIKWQQNNWKSSKGEDVKNPDLWKKLLQFYEKLSVQFIKVKGHMGNKYNEMADQLAVDAIQQVKKK